MKPLPWIICGLLVAAVVLLLRDRRDRAGIESAKDRQYEKERRVMLDSVSVSQGREKHWKLVADSIAAENERMKDHRSTQTIIHEEVHGTRNAGVDEIRDGLLAVPE